MIRCKECKWWDRSREPAQGLRECIFLSGYPGARKSPYANKVEADRYALVHTAPDFGCIAGDAKKKAGVKK